MILRYVFTFLTFVYLTNCSGNSNKDELSGQKEFITPEQFAKYKEFGLKAGFRFVESGPLVRSSYHAEKHLF